jgi:uncharacterized YigZ family protein
MPYSIAAPVHCDFIIKKSRFIGCVQVVADRASAQKVVAALWAEHPGATHVCWALLAGGQSAAVDDGEPSGTAGRPMLEVLRHQDLEGVLATTVRYYGGTPLGAGGLVRAYTDSVAQPMRDAHKVPIIRLRTLRCQAPYAQEGMIRRAIDTAGVSLLSVSHGSVVEFIISLPDTTAEHFIAQLNESGQGRIAWHTDPAP